MNTESPELMKAKRKARSPGRTLCRVFLLGGLIVIGVFGMGVAVISYLCVAHKCYISNRHLISTASIGKVLTISQVASHVAPVTIPLLMGLLSYQVSAEWLKASAAESSDRPSPMQLGILISMFNSANIPSLLTALRYFLGFGQTPEQKAFSSPSILRRPALLLFLFLLNAYLISGSDAWLHVTSEAINIEATVPYSTGSLISEPLGRAINGTKCDEAKAARPGSVSSPSVMYANSCGQISGGSVGDGLSEMPGIRTLSNSSDTHRIVFADDQTAIVVAYKVPPNITYTTSSVGIKSSCRSVTKYCLTRDTSPGGIGYGPNAYLNFKCSSDVNFNATHDFLIAPLDDTGNAVDGYNVSSNPLRVGVVTLSVAYYDDNDTVNYDKFVGNTGWFIHGNGGAWNALICDVAAVDVTYTYKSSTSEFIIKSSNPSSIRDTRAIISYGLSMYRMGNPVAAAVDGAGIQTDMSYEEAYALELSRETIAQGADMYITQDTTDISREIQIIGTKLDLIPFTIMIAMMVTYGCMALVILVLSAITISKTSYIQLVSAHLTDPLVTVHAMYGPKDSVYTWQDKTPKKFGMESNRDLLNVGEFSDELGRTKFTVQKSDISFEAGSFGK